MANIWRNPIFDRTQDDVELAIRMLEEWIKNNISAAEYDRLVRIEDDALVLQSNGVAFINNDALVLQDNGRAYIENDVLVVRIGTVYDLKGCLNVSDINRIEENIAYLSARLSELGYPQSTFTKKWVMNNLPSENDIQRILQNISSIIADFYQQSNAPSLPRTMLSYEEINSIEKNLQLLKELLDCMVGSFRKSNTFKSGTTTFLPIRR